MYHKGFEGFVFVIDTDSYAGNFERDLTAFLTGQIGECEIGQDQIPLFEENCSEELAEYFDKHVTSVPDEHGCTRPTSIWKTPGFWGDGYGHVWPDSKDTTDPEVVTAFESFAKEYGDDSDKEIKRYSAYNSVAIFFDENPNETAVGYMMQRAPGFFKDIGYEVNISGYRVVRTKMIEELIRKIDI